MSLDLSNSDKLASFVQDAKRIGVTSAAAGPQHVRSGFQRRADRRGRRPCATRSARCAMSGSPRWKASSPSAKRGGPFKALYDFAERIDREIRQPPPARKPGQVRRASTRWSQIARARLPRAKSSPPTPSASPKSAPARKQACSAPKNRARVPRSRKRPHGRRKTGSTPSAKASASISPATRSRTSSSTRAIATRRYADILEEGETEPRAYPMAGVVRRIQYRPAMSGGTLAFVSMSDPTGDFEGMVMPENVAAARDVLEVGKAFVFRGRVRWRDGDLKLAADTFEPVEAAEARIGEDLRIVLKEGAPLELLAQTHRRAAEGATPAKRVRCASCCASRTAARSNSTPAAWPREARRARRAQGRARRRARDLEIAQPPRPAALLHARKPQAQHEEDREHGDPNRIDAARRRNHSRPVA